MRRDRAPSPHEPDNDKLSDHHAVADGAAMPVDGGDEGGWDWKDDPILIKSPLGDKLGPNVGPTRMHGTIGAFFLASPRVDSRSPSTGPPVFFSCVYCNFPCMRDLEMKHLLLLTRNS